MAEDRGHSKLGASKAARWLACPGSVALCATLPAPPTTRYAREGSAAHYVAEQCLRSGQDAHDFVGRKLVGFEDIECTPEMADAVQVYVATCRTATTADCKYWIEHPFALLDYDLELFGHNDFAAFRPSSGQLVVVDYKHGAGVPVSPVENRQLKYYGLGALMQIAGGVKSVKLVIVQPRSAGEPVRSWDCSPMDLIEYGGELAEGAERTRQPDAALCPGDHCQFCPAKINAACPALKAAAEALVLNEFADVANINETVRELPADDLADLLGKVPAARMWLNAVEQHAFAEAMRGRAPAGYKLVHKRAQRAWTDGALAMRQAARTLDGVKESELFKHEPLSPAQFEKLVGKDAAEPILSVHLDKPKPGYTLAPLSDKRVPVAPPSESEFSDLIGVSTDD